MRREIVLYLTAVFAVVGIATANTVWTSTDPNGFSNWDIAANWSNGLPGDVDQKPVFTSASDAVECQVTTNTLPFTGNLSLGEGGSTNAVLRVMDGGTITRTNVGDWCAIGYDSTGRLIVEEGGQVILGSHLWMGASNGGVGTLDLNGGYVDIDDALDLGRKLTDASNIGGQGYINLNEGILRFRYYPDASDNVGSLCDIRWGTLAIENNYVNRPSNLWSRIDAGTLVGFGGKGTLKVTREPFDGATLTLVRAIHPLDPFPAYKSTVPQGLVDLSWTNLEPNKPGDPVYVDVWFGTDPNKLSLAYSQVVTAGENTTTVPVDAPVVGIAPTTYYWQVDSYIYGSAEGEPIEGDLFKFDVTDDLPPTVVVNTADTITWVGKPVQVDATVTDTGSSALSIVWTADKAGVTFSPNANVEDPAVTVDNAAGLVTLTCTVSDAYNPEKDSDTVVLNVASDACAAADLAGISANYPMDIAEPFCVVDISDLAAMAVDWLTDYRLTEPMVIP